MNVVKLICVVMCWTVIWVALGTTLVRAAGF